MAGPNHRIAGKRMQLACFILAGLIILSILAWPVLSRASPQAQLCEAAAQQAATRHGVPIDVLRAVALVETGRTRAGRMEPWPWAIHAAGRGQWFGNRTRAVAFAQTKLDTGHRNVDIGCFQINYHWHGQNFTSLDAMIDPARNADYAARLLAQHKARLGAWDLAAGAYHSATPHHAQRYTARFRQMRAQAIPELTTPAPQSRSNGYILLSSAGSTHMGSLVPISGHAQGRPLIDLDPRTP